MEKIKIGICDDEKIFVTILAELIENITKEWKQKLSICRFTSGRELLKEAEEFDLVFLDLEMPDVDGIDIGLELKRKKEECKIVVATSREDRYKEAFLIQAFRFVTKPFEEYEIRQALDAFMLQQQGEGKIEVYYNRIPYQIEKSKIIYIESVQGDCEVVTRQRVYRKAESLLAIKKQLPEHTFIQIRRNIIVNMQYIEKHEKGRIQIQKREISIAKREIKNFEKKYIEYDLYVRG